jgi:Polysaccharide lyase family 4, domain II
MKLSSTGFIPSRIFLLAWCVLCAVHGANAYEADPGIVGATIGGRITIAGAIPKAKPLPVHRDSAVCGMTIPNEALIVDQGSRGITDVVVSVEGVTKGKPFPDNSTLVLENRTCRFFHRANAAVVGSTLEIRNTDPILHNTHIRKDTRMGPTLINVSQPVGTKPILKPLSAPGFFDTRCDAHPFMVGSIHVFEHPYFTVTDETGNFEIGKVPPGTYQLRIWHERLGVREKTIKVQGSASLTVELSLEGEE